MRPNSSVPKFLTKVWALVEDPRTDDYICWNQDGVSFIVLDEESFAKEILPRHFKHNNMTSFVRQLNWYGFHKVTHDETGALKLDKYGTGRYQHPFFKRGQEELLIKIKRKVSVPRMEETKEEPEDMHKVLAFLHQLQGRQDAIDSTVESLKRASNSSWQSAEEGTSSASCQVLGENSAILTHCATRENEALWKEVLQLRQKQFPHQPSLDTVPTSQSYDKMSMLQANPPLMIDSSGNYNQQSMHKNAQEANKVFGSPPWPANRRRTRGTKRAFAIKEDHGDSSAEESSNPVISISVPQGFESDEADDSDSSSDFSSNDSEDMDHEDTTADQSSSFVKLTGSSRISQADKTPNKRMKRTNSEADYTVDSSGAEDTDDHKRLYVASGHAKKCRKSCKTAFLKMEKILNGMHKDSMGLTKRVLALEEHSFQKLSEISVVLSNLADYVMNKQDIQSALFLSAPAAEGTRSKRKERQNFQGRHLGM